MTINEFIDKTKGLSNKELEVIKARFPKYSEVIEDIKRQRGTSDPVAVKSSKFNAVSYSGKESYVDACCGGVDPEEK